MTLPRGLHGARGESAREGDSCSYRFGAPSTGIPCPRTDTAHLDTAPGCQPLRAGGTSLVSWSDRGRPAGAAIREGSVRCCGFLPSSWWLERDCDLESGRMVEMPVRWVEPELGGQERRQIAPDDLRRGPPEWLRVESELLGGGLGANVARREPGQEQPAQNGIERPRLEICSGPRCDRLGCGVGLLCSEASLLDREVGQIAGRPDVVQAEDLPVLVDLDEAFARCAERLRSACLRGAGGRSPGRLGPNCRTRPVASRLRPPSEPC